MNATDTDPPLDAVADAAAATAAAAPPIDRDLTIYHVADLRLRLLAWLDAGAPPLDCAAATECDSAGLQLLLSARHSALARGARWQLSNPGPALTEALARVGLDALLLAPATAA